MDLVDNEWESGASYTGMYYNSFDYDANGNILGQLRKDHTGAVIDSLDYKYARNASGKMVQNRLYHVNDTVNPATFSNDVDDMGTFTSTLNNINTHNNFSFDGIGQLVKDSLDEIESIVWRVDGKVKEIIRYSGSSRKNIKFEYNPMGQRVAKHIYDNSNNWEKSTFYVHDAQGNVMSVYTHSVEDQTISFTQAEKHIYGSSRVGMSVTEIELISAPAYDSTSIQHMVGNKRYELSGHTNNILAVITDKKIPIEDGQNAGEVDYFEPELIASTDYSPFGVRLSERNWNSSAYRSSFQGQEHDDEVKGEGRSVNYTYRMHSPDLGRFFAVDPLTKKYSYYSPYTFSGNQVIYTTELEGLEPNYTLNFPEGTVSVQNYRTTYAELQNINANYISPSSGGGNSNPSKEGGKPLFVEVFCVDCGHNHRDPQTGQMIKKGEYKLISLTKAEIIIHNNEEEIFVKHDENINQSIKENENGLPEKKNSEIFVIKELKDMTGKPSEKENNKTPVPKIVTIDFNSIKGSFPIYYKNKEATTSTINLLAGQLQRPNKEILIYTGNTNEGQKFAQSLFENLIKAGADSSKISITDKGEGNDPATIITSR